MSDEALNAHLDWLDDCAKAQGGEREYVGEIGEIFAFPFGLVQEEIGAWARLSRRILEYLSELLAERNALKKESAALKEIVDYIDSMALFMAAGELPRTAETRAQHLRVIARKVETLLAAEEQQDE